MLRVVNKNAGHLSVYRDKWNGEQFVFDGKGTVIPEHVAQHIFGYGLDEAEKIKRMVRAGWLKTTDPEQLRHAWGIMHNFVFQEVSPDWREVLEEPAPAGKKVA